MHLSRSLVSVDVEATGVDPCAEAIFQIGLTIYRPDGTRQGWVKDFKPWKPIPPEVEELTSRKNEEFENCPPFSEWAERIHRSLYGKDFLGFNLRRFDLPIIDEELRRSGFCLDLRGVVVVDAFTIFSKKNPRKLEDAVRAYCGREHEGAHGAAADSDATLDVFLGQLQTHEDLGALALDEVGKFCAPDNEPVDLAGKLYRDPDGQVRYNFGKHKDARVLEQIGYARWMLEKGKFPGSTIDALREVLQTG